MLVDQLDMPVAAQEEAEIVERADHPLQLDAVDQENGHRNLIFADVIEEDVLHILRLLVGHRAEPFLLFAAKAMVFSSLAFVTLRASP